MSISSDTLRGHTDTIILTQLMRGDNYGYEINKTIQQRTGGAVRLQGGHPLHRLQTPGERRPDHLLLGGGGPRARRRYYAITEEGRRQWEENCREWQNTRALLDALISLEE